jgi:HEXXH motif-containing protein
MIGPLPVPDRYLAELAAGGGGAAAVRLIRAGQLSKRLLQIRAIAAAAPDAVGPGSPWAAGWRLLVQVQRERPDAVAQTLLYPAVGRWATDCLRLLAAGGGPLTAAGGGVAGPGPTQPGQLAAVAAAAAIRAGVRFEIDVPMVGGVVALPGLGTAAAAALTNPATPGSPDQTAWVSGTGSAAAVRIGGIDVPVVAGGRNGHPGWRGPYRLCCQAGGLVLSVLLDDVDPYRPMLDHLPGERVTPAQLRVWQALLERAWALLVAEHRAQAEAMAAGLSTLVPVRADLPDLSRSGTLTSAFGCVALTRPVDEVRFAVTLLHEFQHGKVGGLHDLLALYREPAMAATYYAPWRPDPRPLPGLLHGIAAHLAVAGFWRRRATGDGGTAAQRQFAYWRQALSQALAQLAGPAELTAVGRRFVEAMAATVRGWQAEPVRPAAAEWAEQQALARWTSWRQRYVRSEPPAVDRLLRDRSVGGAGGGGRDGGPNPSNGRD